MTAKALRALSDDSNTANVSSNAHEPASLVQSVRMVGLTERKQQRVGVGASIRFGGFRRYERDRTTVTVTAPQAHS